MRTIIAGPRDYTDYFRVCEGIRSCPWVTTITQVVCGGASGVDELGWNWSVSHRIPCRIYFADWVKYGAPAAGPIRNREMAENADGLIAITRGYTRGTRNMILTAKQHGLQLHVWCTITRARIPW